ncbi:sigma-54-dependent transcriptional regulator [Chondromyces apiculatus]|uniref:Response regulator of zinc sigma-54-dependent two-component system n=1 Tax=Chondromyces apiculatus DSM 436 TaxID=1192034 RepID=A0A017TCT7_9BACT|nr:sigma-54 dependent transcriptional regulator [Chondromyces apiculatus]EYF06620.1 Response regulator of zinc sigma-54-dependent two-component system [Chondromyces apiculatus DSM 436]
MARRALIVDDDPAMCAWLEADLRSRGIEVVTRSSPAEALELISVDDFDVVLTDLNMRGMDGITLCKRASESRPDVPVVLLTAFGSIETAVEAIRAGAYDYITKPVEIETLTLTLERAIAHHTLKAEVRRLRRAVATSDKFGELIGRSDAMKRVYDLLDRISDSEATVLITGESGTGKEVVARALHARSRRASGPFVAINCAAVPEALLESELFGHVRGAFTDARASRPGLFTEASGGTLFLDEIGELPLSMQPKLLRALQERRVRPVGGSTEMPFDVRLIAATNRDLEAAVDEKRFREDLYYRINVILVALPPVRARGSDVLLLAQRFVEDFATRSGKEVTGVSPAAAEKLIAYSWPGNVREIQNCMERAVALTRYGEITVEDLPEKVREHRTSHVIVAGDDPSELVPLEEVERRYILRVLEAAGGNKTLAARILGLDRKTLHRKLDRWEAHGQEPKTGGGS